MEEGVSLAGSLEAPVVIHLGQRPGPATGLPTRTEQADLNLALYAGHGEFPRVIFAPADYQDGITLSCRAFNHAEKYQIPVFILTDQYFLDSSANVPAPDMEAFRQENFIVTTGTDYKRYRLTADGVSPRGVPGNGTGLLCADSDEHDEAGYITEDFGMRTAMVDKRNIKRVALEEDAIAPRFIGPQTYKHCLVGWGSTLGVLREALEKSGRNDVALLHFSQVYPISKSALAPLQAAESRVIIENNATAQFGTLLTTATGLGFNKKILKYNGMPFAVEELVAEIKKL
jgi:2-oxoglutarate ferredoxin oxidoreductase subunit alpha